MAEESIDEVPKENMTAEIRSQHAILLSKARNCFYLTLDRLRSPDADPAHPLNAKLSNYITDVENDLRRIDPEMLFNDRENTFFKTNSLFYRYDVKNLQNYSGRRNDFDELSEESYSSAHSEEHPIIMNSIVNNSHMHTPTRNAIRPKQFSTPRQNNHDSSETFHISRNRYVSTSYILTSKQF